MSSYERSKVLEKIAAGIRDRKEELARSITLQSGKIIRDARAEVDRAVMTFDIASEEAKRLGGELIPLDLSAQTPGRWGITRRFPVGVIAAITPFNFPLNLAAHKVAPALAGGNPSSRNRRRRQPLTRCAWARVFEDAYPPGALNVVTGELAGFGERLATPRLAMITFTGSPAVARRSARPPPS